MTEVVEPRVRKVLDRLSEHKDARSGHDARSRLVCELILPSRTFDLQQKPGDLRRQTLHDPIGVLSAKRLAAFLFGDMLSPAEPWVMPSLMDRDPLAEEAAWFEICTIRMHDRLSGSGSPIATQMFESAVDLVGLGNNCTFRSRPRGKLPRLQSIPMAQAYFSENAENEIDEVYREFTLTARRAFERFPNCSGLKEKAEKNGKAIMTFCHAVEPRPNGVKGGHVARKPWTSTVVWTDEKVLAEPESGFDRMPFHVSRFQRYSGEVYGYGPGWDSYPAVYQCNRISAAIIRGGELAVDPPLFGNAQMFARRLDRRPGAWNPINGNALFNERMQDAVGKLDISGDIGLGVQLLEMQRRQVEEMFHTDWLGLRVGPQMTATEVNYRRQMRMHQMAPMVARIEQEWLNPVVEDVFFSMLEGGFFPPPPQSLAGENITFKYRSPLAMAQRGEYVTAIERSMALTVAASQIDSSAPYVLRADDALRDALRQLGVSERRLRSSEEVDQMRQAAAQRQAANDELAAASTAAGALQQGAQGLASLQQAA